MIPFFTDHGPAHCHGVEDLLNRIIFPPELNPDDPRMLVPTPEEAMYLLAAAWVHDIGMIYGLFPGETWTGRFVGSSTAKITSGGLQGSSALGGRSSVIGMM